MPKTQSSKKSSSSVEVPKRELSLITAAQKAIPFIAKRFDPTVPTDFLFEAIKRLEHFKLGVITLPNYIRSLPEAEEEAFEQEQKLQEKDNAEYLKSQSIDKGNSEDNSVH